MSRSSRLGVVLVVNVALVVALTVAGALSHSTALIADGGHNLTDVASIGLTLVALRWALRPRSEERTFGNHRGTILAALANSAFLALLTAVIAGLGIDRLLHPSRVDGAVVVATAAVAVLVNLGAALFLRDGRDDLNIRATLLHLVSDVVASSFALMAGIVVLTTGGGWERIDPAASLVVAVLIVAGAFRLSKSSVGVLLESTPRDIELEVLRDAMDTVGGVTEVHDLHVWSLSSEVRALSAHVVLKGHPTLEEAQRVGTMLRARICEPFHIAHTTFELECEKCDEVEDDPCGMDAVLLDASVDQLAVHRDH